MGVTNGNEAMGEQITRVSRGRRQTGARKKNSLWPRSLLRRDFAVVPPAPRVALGPHGAGRVGLARVDVFRQVGFFQVIALAVVGRGRQRSVVQCVAGTEVRPTDEPLVPDSCVAAREVMGGTTSANLGIAIDTVQSKEKEITHRRNCSKANKEEKGRDAEKVHNSGK